MLFHAIVRLFPLFKNRNVSVLENAILLLLRSRIQTQNKAYKLHTFKTFKNGYSNKTSLQKQMKKSVLIV